MERFLKPELSRPPDFALFWAKTWESLMSAEIGRYLEARPEEAEDVMLVLRYFDPVNFVSCPALIGVGLKDDVVPAKTVYAIANHLQEPVEIMKFPVSHSNEPEEKRWEEFEARWLELGLLAPNVRAASYNA